MKNKNNHSENTDSPGKFSRKAFLRLSIGSAAAISLGSLAGCGGGARKLRFNDFNQVMVELALIENNLDTLEMQQEWSLYKVLTHLAHTVEGSWKGLASYDPNAQQAVQYVAFAAFVAQGYMSHHLTAPVPSLEGEIADDGPLVEAFDKLRNAITYFQNNLTAESELYEHFAYGKLSYQEWEWANTFHAADHFSSLTY